jgi:hypothetical protein
LLRQFQLTAHRRSFKTLLQLPNPPRELRSNQVLIRFGLRMIILVAFAALGGIGFGSNLAALLWMSIVLCAEVARRRKPPEHR